MKRAEITLLEISKSYFRERKMAKEVGLHAFVVAGLSALDPREDQCLERGNLVVAKEVWRYGTALNDVYDLESFVHKLESPEVNESYNLRVAEKKQREILLNELNMPVVGSYIRQMNGFERWVQKQSEDYGTPERIKQTRELMNAIPTSTLCALAWEQDSLAPMVSQGELESEDLIRLLDLKYKWLIDSRPETSEQRSTVILWNLAMAAQVDDDRIDKLVDEQLGLNTLGTSREVAGLVELKNGYLVQAGDLGYQPAQLHAKVLEVALKTMKIAPAWLARIPHEGLREKMADRVPLLREKWIIQRYLKT